MPGWGGTVRLTQAVGKSKSMEMILTGDPITAYEALKYGLVSKVYPKAKVLEECLKLASKMAKYS